MLLANQFEGQSNWKLVYVSLACIWTIYLDFIEREGDLSKRQSEIHLFAARFKEQSGDIPGVPVAYQLAHSKLPSEIHLEILGTITINVLTWVATTI
ncbi:unnamed protein product [Malus baccata var. baccata]